MVQQLSFYRDSPDITKPIKVDIPLNKETKLWFRISVSLNNIALTFHLLYI